MTDRDHDTIHDEGCPFDGCAGNVETPGKKADKDAYWDQPKLPQDAWERDMQRSGKGHIVKRPARPNRRRGRRPR